MITKTKEDIIVEMCYTMRHDFGLVKTDSTELRINTELIEKKSLTELDDLVESKGLQFGMNLSKYKLDKE